MLSGFAILLNMLTVFVAFVVVVILYVVVGVLRNMRAIAVKHQMSTYAVFKRFLADTGATLRHEKTYEDIMNDPFWSKK